MIELKDSLPLTDRTHLRRTQCCRLANRTEKLTWRWQRFALS